jgi:signal transduction histidine kinase
VDLGASYVRVEIANHGPSAAGPPAGTAHGLIGMRERVALFGGELHAPPAPDGGFSVVARLPLENGVG